MTDDDDPDPAAGIPERVERTESGRHVTDSGRVITNRNVVPRASVGRDDAGDGTGTPPRGVHRSETSGLRDLRLAQVPRAASPNAFELVTPVRPQPRDIFEEEDATLSHDDEPVAAAPVSAPADPLATERGPDRPRITPSYPLPGVREARATPPPGSMAPARASRATPPPGSIAPAGSSRATPLSGSMAPAGSSRLTPPASPATAPVDEPGPGAKRYVSPPPVREPVVPPELEPRRPTAERQVRITPFGALDPRRPSTVRGHVEPRRRPTTPPPVDITPEPPPAAELLDAVAAPAEPAGPAGPAAPAAPRTGRTSSQFPHVRLYDRHSRETPRVSVRLPAEATAEPEPRADEPSLDQPDRGDAAVGDDQRSRDDGSSTASAYGQPSSDRPPRAVSSAEADASGTGSAGLPRGDERPPRASSSGDADGASAAGDARRSRAVSQDPDGVADLPRRYDQLALDRANRETPRLVLSRPPSAPIVPTGEPRARSPSEPSPYDQVIRTGRDSRRLRVPRPPSAPTEPSPYDLSPDRSSPELPRVAMPAADRTASERPLAPVQLDRVLRGVAIVGVLGLGALGLALPGSALRGAVSWLAFLVFVASGWGSIVARVARVRDPDIGLRAALGAAGYLAIAGVLVAAGLLTRPVLLFIITIGVAGFAWREMTAPIASWQHVREAGRFVRKKPALGALIIALAAFAGLRLLGAACALDRNPWDDDLAYTPLVKRLLDTGNLVEPFSFRRLGAYGGQTVLQALGAARGSLANVHLVDKGLGLAIALLAAIGHARERRTQALWLALLAVVVLLLPDTAINTASYWTGVLLFVALYRTVVREYWALVGVVAAATCTLRQNFLAPVVVFVAGVLILRLIALARTMPLREAWLEERRGWAIAGGAGLVALLPWWIAAYLSSHTFLYPIFEGNWNHQLSLSPAVTSWPQELASFVTLCLEPAPFGVLPILAVACGFVIDRRPGRPLTALLVASVVGFALLAHSIVGGEPYHLWRYAFGFTTALVMLLAIEIGSDEDTGIALAPLGRWLVLAALVLQIALGRAAVPRQMLALFDDVREAQVIDRHGDPTLRAERSRYAAMQAAIPAGARTIAMLDDPAMLDYRRNPIASLDTPGFASPGAQLPMFAGAEPLRAYLIAEGYRYAAFVRSERSRYFYRRPFWIWRLFNDGELFEIMSAYALDMIGNLAELATTSLVLYDDDGLVVLDLATRRPDAPARGSPAATTIAEEPLRRAAWVKALADREGLHAAWSLTTRSDLRFEDGIGALRFVDGDIDDPAWTELPAARPSPPASLRGTPILPLYRRAHLRVRTPPGAAPTDMRLTLRAAIALKTVHTRPRLDVSLDGELVAAAVADPAGRYAISVTVPRARLAGGWHDLYLVFSSIADPSSDLRDFRIARLESVEWTPP